jgi:hypothetical protein
MQARQIEQLPKTAECRSVGAGVHTVSADSQLAACSQAVAIVSGLRNALAFVATRRKAS